MIRHDDSVGAQLDGPLRIIGRHHPLDEEWHLKASAKLLERFPVDSRRRRGARVVR
jgi:hypothetical protein